MSDARPPRPGQGSGSTWLLICLLLAPAVVVPLLVPIYDRVDPTLAGFPFYYWFQLALIFVAVILTWIAYVLAKGADRRDREARDREAGRR